MKPVMKSEYRIRVIKNGKDAFVSNAYQMDIEKALEVYVREKESLMNKTTGAEVIIEKHRIETTIENFTNQAEKILRNKND